MQFESLLEPIRPQMARYSERAEQCQVMARERKKSQKTMHKKNVKVVKNDEHASDTDDNVTSSYDNVETAVEDVSFATFMSIYVHQDKGSFDTESVWNRLNDDEKREAICYARSYVLQVPDVTKREWFGVAYYTKILPSAPHRRVEYW